MLAGLVTAPRRFELVEVPDPVPIPGTAVVDIHLCGICGTDLHGFRGPDPYNPAICGHEWVGTVTATGAGVTSVAEGDRVVAAIAPPCGRCDPCRRGRGAYCREAFLGMVGRDALAPPHGGFAPGIRVAAERLVRVRPDLDLTDAAIVEPAAVAFHAVARTPPPLGSVVAVLGCGPIGLLTVQCARAAGAAEVVAIEPDEMRRDLASDVGADAALSPDEANERFGASGADVVFECVGAPATLQSAVDVTRQGGTVNMVGLASGTATIQPGGWLRKEITVVASLGYLHHEFELVMELIARDIVNVRTLHDDTVGLSELPDTIARLAGDPSSAVKVLVDPHR